MDEFTVGQNDFLGCTHFPEYVDLLANNVALYYSYVNSRMCFPHTLHERQLNNLVAAKIYMFWPRIFLVNYYVYRLLNRGCPPEERIALSFIQYNLVMGVYNDLEFSISQWFDE